MYKVRDYFELSFIIAQMSSLDAKIGGGVNFMYFLIAVVGNSFINCKKIQLLLLVMMFGVVRMFHLFYSLSDEN